jgi:hypothetical protein
MSVCQARKVPERFGTAPSAQDAGQSQSDVSEDESSDGDKDDDLEKTPATLKKKTQRRGKPTSVRKRKKALRSKNSRPVSSASKRARTTTDTSRKHAERAERQSEASVASSKPLTHRAVARTSVSPPLEATSLLRDTTPLSSSQQGSHQASRHVPFLPQPTWHRHPALLQNVLLPGQPGGYGQHTHYHVMPHIAGSQRPAHAYPRVDARWLLERQQARPPVPTWQRPSPTWWSHPVAGHPPHSHSSYASYSSYSQVMPQPLMPRQQQRLEQWPHQQRAHSVMMIGTDAGARPVVSAAWDMARVLARSTTAAGQMTATATTATPSTTTPPPTSDQTHVQGITLAL